MAEEQDPRHLDKERWRLLDATGKWLAIEEVPPPKDGTPINVTGGELWDEAGSPTFAGPYLVYWTDRLDGYPEGAWRIKAGFGEVAIVHEPTHWMPVPPDPE